MANRFFPAKIRRSLIEKPKNRKNEVPILVGRPPGTAVLPPSSPPPPPTTCVASVVGSKDVGWIRRLDRGGDPFFAIEEDEEEEEEGGKEKERPFTHTELSHSLIETEEKEKRWIPQ